MIVTKLSKPPFHLPRPTQAAALAGLRYEKKVFLSLKKVGEDVVHNPWYSYTESPNTVSFCSPDILLFRPMQGLLIVIEIKYTYVPEAIEKLRELYVPVVQECHRFKAVPLVIVHNLSGGVKPASTLEEALKSPLPLLQWRKIGPVFPLAYGQVHVRINPQASVSVL